MSTSRFARRELAQGTQGPRGWRIAWREPKRHIDVYSPALLHWVLRLARELFHRIRTALTAPEIEVAETSEMQRTFQERQHLADEYSRGYLAGWRECFAACLTAVDEFARSDDAWSVAPLLSESTTTEQEN